MQIFVVWVLVSGCSLYATWKLMPSAARRQLAGVLLKLPLPNALNQRFRETAMARARCGCDGCDHAPKAAKAWSATSPTAQPITFHPRMRH